MMNHKNVLTLPTNTSFTFNYMYETSFILFVTNLNRSV